MTTSNALNYAKGHLKEIAQAQLDAQECVIENIVEQFGFSDSEANTIFNVYISKKVKGLKYVSGTRKYAVTHGALWEKESMDNALKFAHEFI